MIITDLISFKYVSYIYILKCILLTVGNIVSNYVLSLYGDIKGKQKYISKLKGCSKSGAKGEIYSYKHTKISKLKSHKLWNTKTNQQTSQNNKLTI